jgi:hypothetical protein
MSNGRTRDPAFESSPAETESTNGNRLVASPWHTILFVSTLSLNGYFGWLRASALRQAANVHRPFEFETKHRFYPADQTTLAVVTACPTCRCVSSAQCTSNPPTLVGIIFGPTPRTSS